MNYSLINDGFEIVEDVLSHEELEALHRAVAELPSRHRSGARNLLRNSEAVAALAISSPVNALADAELGADAFPVRALLFDKARAANWKVPWHQDTAIAVAERADAPGFIGWSVKDGVTHVHPPADILGRMAALRIHLDDCAPDNGPLRVLPEFAPSWKLDDEETVAAHDGRSQVLCIARRRSSCDLAASRFISGEIAVPSPGYSHRIRLLRTARWASVVRRSDTDDSANAFDLQALT